MHLFNPMRMQSNQYFIRTSSAYVLIQQVDEVNNLSLTTQGTMNMNPTIKFLLMKLNLGVAGLKVNKNPSLSRGGCV